MAIVMEFSSPQASYQSGCLGTRLKQLNIVMSAPFMFTTHRVLSLALTYGSPGVWTWPLGMPEDCHHGRCHQKGQEEVPGYRASSQCHAPCNSAPVLWPCLRHHPIPGAPMTLCPRKLEGAFQCAQTHLCLTSASGFLFLRPHSIRLLSTHPPSFQGLPPSLFLPTPTHTCASPLLLPLPTAFLDTACLCPTRKSMSLVPHTLLLPTQEQPYPGARRAQCRGLLREEGGKK